jgi:hypothetical protein
LVLACETHFSLKKSSKSIPQRNIQINFICLQIDSAPDDHDSIRDKNTEFSNTESELVAWVSL